MVKEDKSMVNYFDLIKNHKSRYRIGDRVKIIKNNKILHGCIVGILPWYSWNYSPNYDIGHQDFYYILLDDSKNTIFWYRYTKGFIKRTTEKIFSSKVNGHYYNITELINNITKTISIEYTCLLNKKEYYMKFYSKIYKV